MSEMEVLRKFDLTAPMAPFLDVHMVNPLLDFIREVRTLPFNVMVVCVLTFIFVVLLASWN